MREGFELDWWRTYLKAMILLSHWLDVADIDIVV